MTENGAIDRRKWVLSALERYERRLLRFAWRLLGDEHAARDAVQHAFLRLCDEKPEAIDHRLAPWLFAVCRNKALDHLRVTGRGAAWDEDAAAETAGEAVDPAEAAESKELGEQLLPLVDELPAAQREVLLLWLEGFSHGQIAKITERKQGHVRVLMHRGLTRIREHPTTRRLLGEDVTAGRNRS